MRILILFMLQWTFSLQAKELVFSNREEGSITAFVAQEIYVELNKELEKDNIRIVLKSLPDLRAFNQVNMGIIDGDIARVKSPLIKSKYANTYSLNEQVVEMSLMIMAKKGKIDAVSLDNSNLRVGIVRGYVFSEKATSSLHQTKVDNVAQLLKILKLGRVDFVMINQLYGTALADERTIKKNNFVLKSTKHKNIPLFTLIHKKNLPYAKKIEAAIIRMRKSSKDRVGIKRGVQMYYSSLAK